MSASDFFLAVFDFLNLKRTLLCLVATVGALAALHHLYPDLPYFKGIAVGLIMLSLAIGIVLDIRATKRAAVSSDPRRRK